MKKSRQKKSTVEERPTLTYNQGNPIRQYKDRVFRMIFKEKSNFLELYNALNGTEYSCEEDLIVTTLENAIYIGMKNDVSYLLHDQLTLYEHQSTKNPNLPLRNLFYVSDIYSGLVNHENLYGSKPVQIPEPVFVVFYNGRDQLPEQSVLRFSDLYMSKSEAPALELTTLVLNINQGYNQKLMEKCRSLREYTIFVSRVREYGSTLPFEQAVELAIDTCIADGVLEEFLRKNRAEVKRVSIYEYNEELHMQQEREAAMEEGFQKGIQQGIEQGIQQGIQQGIEQGIVHGIQQGNYIRLIGQVRKKAEKHLEAAEIAEALEEDPELISGLCRLITENQGATDDEIYHLWTMK